VKLQCDGAGSEGRVHGFSGLQRIWTVARENKTRSSLVVTRALHPSEFFQEGTVALCQPAGCNADMQELEPMIALVEAAQHRTEQVLGRYADLLPANCDAWHPIPFFGPLHRATIITAAMNPSADELRGGRWPQSLPAQVLAGRLTDYFSDPVHPPHLWFAKAVRPLQGLRLCYGREVAHIDVVCRATRTLKTEDTTRFLQLADDEAHLFFSALKTAGHAKILILSGSVTKARYAHEHIARHAAAAGWQFSPPPRREHGGPFVSRHELRAGDRLLPVLFTSASVNRRSGPGEYEKLVARELGWIAQQLRG
jgi:hypothetical protein